MAKSTKSKQKRKYDPMQELEETQSNAMLNITHNRVNFKAKNVKKKEYSIKSLQHPNNKKGTARSACGF